MQGASPLASPGAEPMVRRKTERKRFPASNAARVQSPGTCMQGAASAASGLMQGCRGCAPHWDMDGRSCKCRLRLRRGDARGEAPCIRKLKNSPFPAGEGGRGGWGGKKVHQRQGEPATKKASPPADSGTARSAGDKEGTPPKNHSSASSSRKAVTKPRAAASSDASAKIRRRGSVPENRQITKELSAK